MIKLKVDKIRFSIPQGWNELTYGQYIAVVNPANSFLQVIEALSSLDALTINRLGESFTEALVTFLQWMQTPIDIGNWEPPVVIDINQETFGKLLELELMQKEMNIEAVIKIYWPDMDVHAMPLYDAISLVNHLNKQLEAYQKKESDHLHFKPTNEQVRAGIDKFNIFGRTNTLDSLAGGDILRYKNVCALDVNTIFAKLKRMKIESDYQRNYSRIMSEKK